MVTGTCSLVCHVYTFCLEWAFTTQFTPCLLLLYEFCLDLLQLLQPDSWPSSTHSCLLMAVSETDQTLWGYTTIYRQGGGVSETDQTMWGCMTIYRHGGGFSETDQTLWGCMTIYRQGGGGGSLRQIRQCEGAGPSIGKGGGGGSLRQIRHCEGAGPSIGKVGSALLDRSRFCRLTNISECVFSISVSRSLAKCAISLVLWIEACSLGSVCVWSKIHEGS